MKKRVIFYFISIIITFSFMLNVLKSQLLPFILRYGDHLCENVSTKLVNYVVNKNISEELKKQIVISSAGTSVYIDFNTSILNSISSKAVLQIQKYYEQLSNRELDDKIINDLDLSENYNLYEVPLSNIFGNPFISYLGPDIPIKYRLVNDVSSEIVSNLEEYGINNALLEIVLIINVNIAIDLPAISKLKKISIEVPLIIKLIQGNIPESFFGQNVIGGTK